MKLKEVRRLNLLYLADRVHGRQKLAELMGFADTNYLNLIARGHSNIGDAAADKIEKAANKPSGWLDTPHPNLWGQDSMEALRFSEDLLKCLSSADIARLVELSLKEMASRQE